jgi:MscS family membrane protein
MKKFFSIVSILLLVLVLVAALPGPKAQTPEDNNKQSSPRATVRTLLTSINAARNNPRFIDAAVACLDVTGLGANQTPSRLAFQLEAILRDRDVDTDRIPDEDEDGVYLFPDVQGRRIALKRTSNGRWVFDRDTVVQIPDLYAEAQKRLQDKNKEAAALNVSPEFASPRAAFRTFLKAVRAQDTPRLLHCLDLRDIPVAAQEQVGKQLAHKLQQTIFRARMIIYQEMPDTNYCDPFIWLSQPEGVIELVRTPSGDQKGEWRFSRETVRSLDPLYASFENKPYTAELLAMASISLLPDFMSAPELWLRNQTPAWLKVTVFHTRTMHLQLYEVFGYILLPIVAYALYRLITWLLVGFVYWVLLRRGCELKHDVIARKLRPTGRFLGVEFLRWGILVLGADTTVLSMSLTVLNPLLWLLGTWAMFRLIDLVGKLMDNQTTEDKGRLEITQMLWPVSSLATKIVLFLVTLFNLMALFAWDVTTVLTGLGIGGVAFALGAQDSLKNLFGSFTLIADRPFVVGESVQIGNQDVGVVEVVGLRSTRIRTADDTLLIVPNSNLTTMNITNFGRRRYHRYSTKIGVAYTTPPEMLIAFRDGIRKAIRNHECTRKDGFEVTINDLADSAVEILVNVYFEIANRPQELEARDELILAILRLADELHINLAYPTQTVHLAPASEVSIRQLQPLPAGANGNEDSTAHYRT